ncbi:enoyl-CoA hydratase-related protein [Deltaproteobacteria bacterium TL4]
MSYQTLDLEIEDALAKITLNRPKANSMNLEMMKDLMQVSTFCEESKNIRAVLLTGAGNMFCAGGDVSAFAQAGAQLPVLLKEMTMYLHTAVSNFSRMKAPVVVAVNGVAAGAGMFLAMAGDLVYASESARFTSAYTGIGLSPDGSSTFILTRLIGVRRTKELLLTNRMLSAQEALEWGLVNRVLPAEDLLREAEALAIRLSQGATQAYGAVKELVINSTSTSLETQLQQEARFIARMGGTADARAGVAAFLAKKVPIFTGA